MRTRALPSSASTVDTGGFAGAAATIINEIAIAHESARKFRMAVSRNGAQRFRARDVIGKK